MSINLIELSKVVSYALRHKPEDFGLHLDSDGWGNLSDLLAGLAKRDLNVNEDTIIQMVEKSEKKRHQLLDGRIRAYYGHSTTEKIIKTPSTPPQILFHGTNNIAFENIEQHGLIPMDRQYVHLSIDEATAIQVAHRRCLPIVILRVAALKAYKDGIAFYQEDNGIWLCDSIPPKYLTRL